MKLDLSDLPLWLVERGIKGLPLDEQVEGFCRRIVEAGFPARRFNMSLGTLHPRHGARSYIWTPHGMETAEFPRRRTVEENEGYLKSPIYYLRSSGQGRLRRRIDKDGALDFPVLADLRDAGMTEYAAQMVHYGDRLLATGAGGRGGVDQPDPLQGIFFSCATDTPGGFDDDELEQVGSVLPYFALAVKSRSTTDVATTLLETYLGADAGRRVLTGEIDRHSLRHIDAVIWLCDLRGFSAMANRVTHDELIEILDAYLDLMARPVLDNRGQILKFMGDGFLATFDLQQRDRKDVCLDAVRAAEQLLETVPRFNAERIAAGQQTMEFGIGLHLGEVVYGNIGASERLDFTVIGSAVNETSRIEGLCRPLQRNVLISNSFREAAAVSASRMISVGFQVLRGVREPQELFTIQATA